MFKEITVSKLLTYILILIFLVLLIIKYYGGYFKDSITKKTCTILNEKYEDGLKSGEGRCVVKAAYFD